MRTPKASKTDSSLAGLAGLAKQLNPEFPFSYKLSDEEYDKLYRSDHVIGRLSMIFAILHSFCPGQPGEEPEVRMNADGLPAIQPQL